MLVAAVLGLSACQANRSEPLRIVGSSTVYPFASLVAERFSAESGTPVIVEQTGSGGGHKLFCAPDSTAQATTSSRPRLPAEIALCAQHGRADVEETLLGYDGIALIAARESAWSGVAIRRADLWRGLAARIPDADCALRPNPHIRWNELASGLPDVAISVLGPPPTSGTRDGFMQLALFEGALSDACMATLLRERPGSFQSALALRRDGAWTDSGENDDALIQQVLGQPDALGVVGYSALRRRDVALTAVAVDGVRPAADTIAKGTYPLARGLYLYFDPISAPAMRAYADLFSQPDATGPSGYLTQAGLVPAEPEP